MSPLSVPRRVHVIGLLGSALLISGLFFPWIITTFFEPSPQSVTNSFWSLLMSQVPFLRFEGFSVVAVISVGFYFFMLLPFLTGILTSLLVFSGKGNASSSFSISSLSSLVC